MNEGTESKDLAVLKASPVIIPEKTKPHSCHTIFYTLKGMRKTTKANAKIDRVKLPIVSLALLETPYEGTWVRVMTILSPTDQPKERFKGRVIIERANKSYKIMMNFQKETSPKKKLYLHLEPIRNKEILEYLDDCGIDLKPFEVETTRKHRGKLITEKLAHKISIIRQEELTEYEAQLIPKVLTRKIAAENQSVRRMLND